MAKKSNAWFWIALAGGAAAYAFYTIRDDGVTLLGTTGVPPRRQATPTGTTPPTSTTTPAPAPPSTYAPTYIVAARCTFATTESHPVYAGTDRSLPAALLPGGSTVTVVEKRVIDGVMWFGTMLAGSETLPALAGSILRFPLWFRPNATERSRCS